VRVFTGDTDVTPYGGGTWASRGAGIGGEAVLLASRQALRENILELAAGSPDARGRRLAVRRGPGPRLLTGEALMRWHELGRIAYFRPDTCCRPASSPS
jgi:carbon-monoxide dehydrogenase large subunit